MKDPETRRLVMRFLWGAIAALLLTMVVLAVRNDTNGREAKERQGQRRTLKGTETWAVGGPHEAPPPSPVGQRGAAAKKLPLAPPEYVFDVPSLVGKNIDEIRAILGAPEGSSESHEPPQKLVDLGLADEWSNSFEKDGEHLLVYYTFSTRRVVSFFISFSDLSLARTKEDKARLIEIGNLKESDTWYTVEFVKALGEPSSFTGLRVVPGN